MRDVFRKLGFYFAFELVVKHVRFGDCQYSVLDEKLRIVFAKLIQEYFISLSDVILIGSYHEEED